MTPTQRPITVSAVQPAGKTYGEADPLLDYDVTLGNLVFSDAFAGALAVHWAEHDSLVDAVRFGNAAGALAVAREGAQPGIPFRREIEALCRSLG